MAEEMRIVLFPEVNKTILGKKIKCFSLIGWTESAKYKWMYLYH